MESVFLLGCCVAEGIGNYRCHLYVATKVDQEKQFFPVPLACRTAVKLDVPAVVLGAFTDKHFALQPVALPVNANRKRVTCPT